MPALQSHTGFDQQIKMFNNIDVTVSSDLNTPLT